MFKHKKNSPPTQRRWPQFRMLPVLASVLLLGGCAGAMRNYDTEMSGTMTQLKSGKVDQALAQLEANNTSADKDLLYFLEKGELLRMNSNFADSRAAWLKADESVRAWEDIAKTDPQKLWGEIGSFLVNDKTRRYDGQDYEKVLLSARLAMAHLAVGNWDDARVEVKKMHEREAIIAELRSKEVEATKEKAKESKVETTMKDLKGYPVEIFDDPEVINLRNGYQSAIGHYLAGYVYEALGESSLAAAGYRQAIELRPKQPLLQSALAELDRRAANHKSGFSDVLFVIEAGAAPAWKSVTLPIPVPTRRSFVLTPTAFPVIKSQGDNSLPATLRVAGKELKVAAVTNVDAQARRALKDQMPGIIVRSVIRAVAKGVLQSEVQKRDNTGLLTVATMIANFASEQADERSWRSLPGIIGIARASLPVGKHVIQTPNGSQEINVGGKYSLVTLRYGDGHTYLTQSPASLSTATVVSDSSSVTPTQPAEAVSDKKKAKKVKKSARKGADKEDQEVDQAKPVSLTGKGKEKAQ